MQDIFANINKVIERDSKSTTYKFALLRGTIEIIQENSPYIKVVGERIEIPFGLLIEKWILFYYPLLESEIKILQAGRNVRLAFEEPLLQLIEQYHLLGGISTFYQNLRTNDLPAAFQANFQSLVREVRKTISQMPMKHLGVSVYGTEYSIYQLAEPFSKRRIRQKDTADLIKENGSFSIPRAYYDAFKILGSFIHGNSSLLMQWANFSVSRSESNVEASDVLARFLQTPVNERDVQVSKKHFDSQLKKRGNLPCVWTGKEISNFDLDHVLPFSIWRNNELWNLLPANPKVNAQKRDKIPSPELIWKQKDIILSYWEGLFLAHSSRFQREVQHSLLGEKSFADWPELALEQIQNNAAYLIDQRGYESWTPKI